MVTGPRSCLLVRAMSTDDALRVAEWRYPDQWSVYDLSSARSILDELDLYRAVIDTGRDALIGVCCIGTAARVSGLDEDPSLIDVGVGMDPNMVGRGKGPEFGRAVMNYFAFRYPGRSMRAVVQSWNERSLRLARRLGFVDVGELISTRYGQPVRYRVLIK